MKHALKFKEIKGCVQYVDVSFSGRELSDGEVLKEFETYEDKEEYLMPVVSDRAKKFQIREVEGELVVYRVDKTEDEMMSVKKEELQIRNNAINEALRHDDFVDKQMKCLRLGLSFNEEYPELAEAMQGLVDEYNKNEETIESLN